MFTFTPYNDPSPPSWEVVANSMSSFWRIQDVFPEQYIVCCRLKQSSVVHQVYQWYDALWQDPP